MSLPTELVALRGPQTCSLRPVSSPDLHSRVETLPQYCITSCGIGLFHGWASCSFLDSTLCAWFSSMKLHFVRCSSQRVNACGTHMQSYMNGSANAEHGDEDKNPTLYSVAFISNLKRPVRSSRSCLIPMLNVRTHRDPQTARP